MTYANGDVYEGAFQNDKRQGQGTFRGTDGYVYEGEWVEGRIEGQGTVTILTGRSMSASSATIFRRHRQDHLSRRLHL